MAESDREVFTTVGNGVLPTQLTRIAAKYIREVGQLETEFDVADIPEPDADLRAVLSDDAAMRIGIHAMVRSLRGEGPDWPNWEIFHAESSVGRASAIVDAIRLGDTSKNAVEFLLVGSDELAAARCLSLESELAAKQRSASLPTGMWIRARRTKVEHLCRQSMELSSHFDKFVGDDEGQASVQVVSHGSQRGTYRIKNDPSSIHWLEPVDGKSQIADSPHLGTPSTSAIEVERESVPLRDQLEALLRRDGDVWHLKFGDEECRFPHAVGFLTLHRLLLSAGAEVDVWELQHGVALPLHLRTAPDPMMDLEGSKKLQRIAEELGPALGGEGIESSGQGRTQEEIAAIASELARSGNFGNRGRKIPTEHDRCRDSVRKALADALGKIATRAPRAHAHLDRAIENPQGYRPCYREDPAVRWVLS